MPGGETLLAAGLNRARTNSHPFPCRFVGDTLAQICHHALEMGIETEYVTRLIASLGVSPPLRAAASWPWPVKIRTLGEFRICVDGSEVTFLRKTPRKILALLAQLIAPGGERVRESRLLDALWPDADGDAAAAAMKVSLARLRNLLGDPGTVRSENSLVSLNLRRIWVDALAIERAIEQESAADWLSLYKGDFLPQEEASWALPMRQRLRR